MSFEEIADQRRLSSAKARLVELQWEVEPDGYQRRKVPAGLPLEAFSIFLNRRGLEPLLVNYVFDTLANRPLERALVAWDVARGCLLGTNDGPLIERLPKEMAPLKQLGPPAAAAVPRDRLAAFIEAIRASSDTTRVPDDFSTNPSLAGILALDAKDNAEAVAAINAHAKLLAYAHLPSLALAFLQLAWERFAPPSSLDLMLDLGLDHGMVAGFPALTGTDDRSVQQQAYIAIRACAHEYDVVSGAQLLEALDKVPAIHGSTHPKLVLARAELAVLRREQIDDASKQIIECAASSTSRQAADRWRYAEFVKHAVDLQTSGSASSDVDLFIGTFGNNARLWGHAAHRQDARGELLTLLSRELRFCSHDPEAWRAFAVFMMDEDEEISVVDSELGEHLLAQWLAAYA